MSAPSTAKIPSAINTLAAKMVTAWPQAKRKKSLLTPPDSKTATGKRMHDAKLVTTANSSAKIPIAARFPKKIRLSEMGRCTRFWKSRLSGKIVSHRHKITEPTVPMDKTIKKYSSGIVPTNGSKAR